MNTVIELLHLGARAYGDMPYLGEKTGDSYSVTSFAEADRLSLSFAAALALKGLRKGDAVAILSEGRTSWVISEFGALKAGCVSVPLSTKLTPDEILFRLDHSEARAVMVSENNFQKIAGILPRVHRQPTVICLSKRTESLKAMIAATNLVDGKDLYFYDALLAEGQRGLDAPAAANGKTFGGKPLTWVMRETEKEISIDDPVTISYTSGTTGNPKGIMLSHRNYWHNAHEAAKVVEVQEGWKSLIMLPLDHSFAHTVGIYIFLLRGIAMYFVDARGGPLSALRNLPKNLLEVNPDFLLTVPALSGNFMKKMIQGVEAKGSFINGIFMRGVAAGILRGGNGFNKPPLGVRIAAWPAWALANALIFPRLRSIFGADIKFCVGGGALLEIRQQEFFNAIGVPVYQGYGLTENAPIICANSERRHKFGTSGTIIPNLDVRIMKDGKTACAPGEIGEIVTRGDSVMKGYFKNPEATALAIQDGWLRTGDLGFIDADGFLVVTGREKALLIAQDGEKYSPETIEEAIINSSRFVDQVMVYNDQCRFTSALVTLNRGALASDLRAKGIPAPGEPGFNPDAVIEIIKRDLLAFAERGEYGSIPAQWRPASFAVIPEAFSEENGLINSTLKLVRHKAADFYRDRIKELYACETADPRTAGNRQALERLFGGENLTFT